MRLLPGLQEVANDAYYGTAEGAPRRAAWVRGGEDLQGHRRLGESAAGLGDGPGPGSSTLEVILRTVKKKGIE